MAPEPVRDDARWVWWVLCAVATYLATSGLTLWLGWRLWSRVVEQPERVLWWSIAMAGIGAWSWCRATGGTRV